MIFGAVSVAISLVLFAWAGEIAAAIGDPVQKMGTGSRTALIIALISFWVVSCLVESFCVTFKRN